MMKLEVLYSAMKILSALYYLLLALEMTVNLQLIHYSFINLMLYCYAIWSSCSYLTF